MSLREKALSGYLGSNEKNWQEYDATQLILDGLSSPNTILIDQGASDNFLKNQLKPELFETACKQKNQLLKLRMQPGFDHSGFFHFSFFISSFMQDHINFHAENLNKNFQFNKFQVLLKLFFQIQKKVLHLSQ